MESASNLIGKYAQVFENDVYLELMKTVKRYDIDHYISDPYLHSQNPV